MSKRVILFWAIAASVWWSFSALEYSVWALERLTGFCVGAIW